MGFSAAQYDENATEFTEEEQDPSTAFNAICCIRLLHTVYYDILHAIYTCHERRSRPSLPLSPMIRSILVLSHDSPGCVRAPCASGYAYRLLTQQCMPHFGTLYVVDRSTTQYAHRSAAYVYCIQCTTVHCGLLQCSTVYCAHAICYVRFTTHYILHVNLLH